jgi:hypothetical protein
MRTRRHAALAGRAQRVRRRHQPEEDQAGQDRVARQAPATGAQRRAGAALEVRCGGSRPPRWFRRFWRSPPRARRKIPATQTGSAISGKPRAAAAPIGWCHYRPFHIIGNLYFVGSRNLGTYLITTPQGNILINPNFDANVAMIKDSIERLGFKYADTKILLISHAHSDHNAGAAKVMAQTGAKYAVMEGDVATVETGGAADFQYGDKPGGLYAKAKVDGYCMTATRWNWAARCSPRI